MVREKIERRAEHRVVVYDERRWALLRKLREEATRIMKSLMEAGIASIVHGSVARGDVHEGSDIDIFVPFTIPSYRIELALERGGFHISHKLIVQATPSSTPKAYIVLDPDEKRVVSFPLGKLAKREYEFYYFGGALDLQGLLRNIRVPGVDKRLVLIEPTPQGHIEYSIIGREAEAARKIGISVETVLERVRVLTRRDEVGRTGVFVKVELEPWDSIEEAAKRVARNNPLFRRALRERASPIV